MKEPWEQDNEPPVPHATGETLADGGVAARAEASESDKHDYIAERSQFTLQEAERELLAIEYDYRNAIEDDIAASLEYTDAESQQARTRVRVIEKLMAESEAAVGRKQNEAKRGETLSISAAEKIVSGHPEYTAIRDQVAQKLNTKTEAERRRAMLEQLMLNMREIVQSRRKFGLLYKYENVESGELPGAVDLRNFATRVGVRESERETIATHDSRGLDGIERKPMLRNDRGAPTTELQMLMARDLADQKAHNALGHPARHAVDDSFDNK